MKLKAFKMYKNFVFKAISGKIVQPKPCYNLVNNGGTQNGSTL